MRFARMERSESFAWTSLKAASALGKPARERRRMDAAYPLLAPLHPEPAAVDLDAEAARRQRLTLRSDLAQRAASARIWRRARRDFFAATPGQADDIRRAWAAWRGPLTAFYYGYVVDVHTGRQEARAEAVRAATRERRRAAAVPAYAQCRLELD